MTNKSCLLIGAVLTIAFNINKLQAQSTADRWIRPAHSKSAAIWGIKNGIVFSIWPSPIEGTDQENTGGPRGLIRVGYESKGTIYHINYLAVEPVVDDKMEFSEISPSQIDSRWGKLMWAGNDPTQTDYFPAAKTRGAISHPDSQHPGVEELSVYLFMERFMNGAHPYLRLSIRSDRPEELGIEIFNHKESARMQRCAITATMGNYSRLRNLYLKDGVVSAKELYKGFDGIDFIEKQSYPLQQMLRDDNADFIAIAAPDEDFASLTSWPQDKAYLAKAGWRYRPDVKFTQYWRKESAKYDPSLMIRVNGRAKYWSGASPNPNDYVNIPGGPAFENFELRENYYPGEKFYYGITTKTPQQLVRSLKDKQ
ncbi:hypothetical protein [Mucilaginibacter sp. UR6-11]|uniref:hypothetical protein n=1 Tax=Mucilaginibacter sp. UR6-11 TaxID=1435644 RepID=UPI001E44A7CB|nr:hypothetical protein [Mucilaginibacter sp. UR6-11]MCC8424740.1 hypothetical protein [Mucilaginibacter sp. UR6-11]